MMQNATLLDNAQQKLRAVDKEGNLTGGIIERQKAHTAPGIKHLAIQVLLFNSKNNLFSTGEKTKKLAGTPGILLPHTF